MKKIVVVIAKDGKVETTVHNIAGPSCGTATGFLEQLGKVVDHKHTDEYYAAATETDTVEAGGW